jgi:hypothetical protein
MNTQTVTNSLIQHLNSLTGKKGKGMAVNSKGGYFLLVFGENMGGEYTRVSIEDNIGEAYYIRLKTGVVNEQILTSKRRGSCKDTSQVKAACRLVAMSHCDSIQVLADKFRNGIASFSKRTIDGYTTDALATVTSVQYDFATIVNEETPESERAELSGHEGGMSLIAIDFDLSYVLESCPVSAENSCC